MRIRRRKNPDRLFSSRGVDDVGRLTHRRTLGRGNFTLQDENAGKHISLARVVATLRPSSVKNADYAKALLSRGGLAVGMMAASQARKEIASQASNLRKL